MGIHIVLDMALNHCSSDNPIFKDAISNPNSPYRDWFYIDKNGNYRYWYGEFTDMPVFNQASQGYRNYVYGENGIIAKFAPFVDGFRLDVAEELWPDVLEGIRNRANENKAHVIIAEYWNRAQTSYFGRCFDGTTNYLYTNAMYKWLMDGESNYFASQIKDLLHYYKRIGSMYEQNREMLKDPSNYKPIRYDDVVCYERGNLLIVVSRAKSAQNINIPQEFYDGDGPKRKIFYEKVRPHRKIAQINS